MNRANYAFTVVISGLVLIGAGCNININAPAIEAPVKDTADTTQNTPASQNEVVQNTQKLPAGWLLYNDQQANISYGYPEDFTISTKQRAPKTVVNDIIATRFDIPQRFITGTNLGTDSAIFVYKDCTIEGMEQADSKQVIKNGKTFTEFIKFDAGAGNQYNAVLISQKIDASCINVLLYMHSLNVANFIPEQVITQFDHAQLTNIAYGMAGSVEAVK